VAAVCSRPPGGRRRDAQRTGDVLTNPFLVGRRVAVDTGYRVGGHRREQAGLPGIQLGTLPAQRGQQFDTLRMRL